MKRKLIRIITLLTFHFALFTVIPTTAFADTQVYPPAGFSTPYGNGRESQNEQCRNITCSGDTEAHLIGQTIKIPSGIGQITKVRLDNFRLTSGTNGQGKNQGIFSVALFAGEPSITNSLHTSFDGYTDPLNYWGIKISENPANFRARLERVFVLGRTESRGVFEQLCGANGEASKLMSRMRINDPTRPCPRYTEWDRVYPLLDSASGQGGQLDDTQRDEFAAMNSGTSYQGHARISGDSEFLEPAGGWSTLTNFDNLGQYLEGPNFKSWGGGKNEVNDVSFEVTLPANAVIPGQTYFLSIQGSHISDDWSTRSGEEGGYWEQKTFNCEVPNKPINTIENDNPPLYFSGKDNATGLEDQTKGSGSGLCGKDNVISASVSKNNPYLDGIAYSQNGGGSLTDSDVTDLTIWGIPPPPAPTNPRATCRADGTAYFTWDNVSTADRYWIRVNNTLNNSNWLGLNDFSADIKGPGYACVGSSCSFTSGASDSLPNLDISFCPKTNGVCASDGSEYTNGPSNIVPGQPYSWSIQSVGAGGATDSTSGGPSRTIDYTLNCPPPPPPPPSATPSCDSPANGTTLSTNTDPTNLTFTWGTVANGTSYSFKLDYQDVVSNWQNFVNTSGIAPTSGATSYTVTTINPYSMNNLRWQVWASNAGGDGPVSTCTFSLPQPSLFVLNSTPVTASGAVDAGPDLTSGLRSDDPNLSTGTTGKNYRNAANFNLSLLNAGIYNTLLQGVAFAGPDPLDNNGSPGALYTLTRSANDTNGFVIVYNPSNAATAEQYFDPTYVPPFGIGPPPAGPVWTFNKNTYHIYYQGKWNVNNDLAGYIPYIRTDPGNSRIYSNPALEVQMTTDDTSDINNPVFQVTFLKPLGSRTWGTYGYLKQRYYQAADDQYFSLVYPRRGI